MKNSILLTSGPTTNRVTAHSVVRRWDEGRAKSLPSFSGLHHFFVLRFAFSIIHGRGRAQTTTTKKKWLYYTECKPKRKKKNEWGLETRSQELNFKALGLLFHFPVMCLTLSNVLLVSMFLLLSPCSHVHWIPHWWDTLLLWLLPSSPLTTPTPPLSPSQKIEPSKWGHYWFLCYQLASYCG